MKYICKVCGFIYDEAKSDHAFSSLSDDWTCPVCSVTKSNFAVQGEEEKTRVVKRSAAESDALAVHSDVLINNMSAQELSVLFSNLARGCEKQYKDGEAALFNELADYFEATAVGVKNADISSLKARLDEDLSTGYPDIMAASKVAPDRGAGRICVWGEKVSVALSSLLERYEKDGDKIVLDTEIWVCAICGFISIGDKPPKLCPVCKVQDWKFEKIERRAKV